MRFPFYIAWRYLFAKKTHNAINVITLVSVTGVAVGAMALVVVLSVFNGFERVIMSLFNAFHPDLEITLAEGKTFSMEDFPEESLNEVPGVVNYSEILEESGMITHRERQHLVTLRGVDAAYKDITGIDTLLTRGEYELERHERNFLIPGQGVANVINASVHDLLNPVDIYIPARGRTAGLHPAQAFRSTSAFVSGIFHVQAEYDMEYVITSLRLMRRLLDYDDEVTSVIVGLQAGVNHADVQKEVQALLGPEYEVKDRLQQQDFLYRVMRSEKWAIFFILTFILIIAAFNIIGSLTMLIIEKRRDIAVLRSMGATRKTINQVFMLEGVFISLGGAIAGILLGGLIAGLQMHYGLIGIQAEGAFIIDAYPVEVQTPDLFLVAATVFCIGVLASLIPVSNMWKSPETPPE